MDKVDKFMLQANTWGGERRFKHVSLLHANDRFCFEGICDNIFLHTRSRCDTSIKLLSICDVEQYHISHSVFLPITVTKLQDAAAIF